MRAVLIKRNSDPRLVIGRVAEPVAGSSEAIVDVEVIALNPGELRSLKAKPDGARIGWDFAGRVSVPARDGSGPPAGARVVGTSKSGAWAERHASATDLLAVVPDNLELDIAVCLPVPGITAYLGLHQGGLLFGKRVLLTGAAGAVGQYTSQIALASGARVSAAVRRDAQVPQVTSHGVVDVRVGEGLDAFTGSEERFDLIVDVVGGAVARDAAALLVSDGHYVVVSAVGGDTLPMPVMPMLMVNGHLDVINMFGAIQRGPDTGAEILNRLVASAAMGEITAPLGPRGSWEDIEDIARAYLASPDRAKPVLRLNGVVL
ncbi:zinc-binding dehydrogenase [uncultured Roseobacter sp.]|uniref:zinc-binding dehydrogenase n=1 Tax=uncultured Roseobacter sp. TaxID=114847 RepID=UPI0026197EBF|nr:zinc-binding dehydrogenase [uncultured Roseobacter sp.]